jgi:hypothetical protein
MKEVLETKMIPETNWNMSSYACATPPVAAKKVVEVSQDGTN